MKITFAAVTFILLNCCIQAQWVNQKSLPNDCELYCVRFISSQIGWAVGGGGTIIKTTNGGKTWSLQPVVTKSTFLGVFFTDANNGTIVGGNSYGEIFRTTNGGNTWTSQTTWVPNYCRSVFFTNKNTGIAVGDCAKIYRTTDGGATWTDTPTKPYPFLSYLNDVFFKDPNNGYAVGWCLWTNKGEYFNIILKTTDGGKSWIDKSNVIKANLNGVFFTDVNTGFAVGNKGSILKTTDGGTTWIKDSSGTTNDLRSVYFTDVNNGTVVGNNGTILRTTDGGANWILQPGLTANNLNSVFFTNVNSGITVGGNSKGVSGTLLRTTNGGGIFIDVNEEETSASPAAFILSQNYPNPFNPGTTISYSIANKSHVELKVYDMIGREVATLVSKEQDIGEYKVSFNGASQPSGVYIYTIQAGEFRDSKKLVLMK